jgi:hypothetical protein
MKGTHSNNAYKCKRVQPLKVRLPSVEAVRFHDVCKAVAWELVLALLKLSVNSELQIHQVRPIAAMSQNQAKCNIKSQLASGKGMAKEIRSRCLDRK